MGSWEVGGLSFRVFRVGFWGLRGVWRYSIGGVEIADLRGSECGGVMTILLEGAMRRRVWPFWASARRCDGGASWVLTGPVCPSATGRF